jgi:hypothetical protein
MFSMTTMASSNDGGPDIAQENEDHENDQGDGDQQGDFDVVNGGADGRGAVDGNFEVKRGRNRGAEFRQDGLDAVHGFDHVGAGLAKDREDDGRFAAREAEVANVFDAVGNVGDIPQADRGADVTSDDEPLIFVGLKQLIGVGDGPHVGGISNRAFCKVGIGSLQTLADGF